MGECIFCKIIQGEIPALTIYKDNLFLAFLDINPRSKGHTLIVPLKHVERFDELQEEEIMHLGILTKYLAIKLTDSFGATGYNIAVNNGESAGQVVKHLHLHIIPRYGDKGHSFEAAFPIDEDSKNNLSAIHKEIGVIPPLGDIIKKDEKIKKEGQHKSEGERKEERGWIYDDDLLDQID